MENSREKQAFYFYMDQSVWSVLINGKRPYRGLGEEQQGSVCRFITSSSCTCKVCL